MRVKTLRYKFALIICCVYIVIGFLTLLAFHLFTGKVVDSLGTRYAIKQALLEKSKLLAVLQYDLVLSRKMCSSPLLVQWALDEQNRVLRKQALEELESYRTCLKGKSLFFAPDRTRHYYFLDGTHSPLDEKPRYTLMHANPNDAWYFRSMGNSSDFELNVDYDNKLDVTKVWFNVAIKDRADHRIGIAGSGMDISEFIKETVTPDEKGTETILFGNDGALEGHRDRKYVMYNSKVRGAEKKVTIYDLIDDPAGRTALKTAVASLVAGPSEVETRYLSIGGKRYLAAISYLKDIKWFNLVMVDAANVVGTRDFLPILVITIVSMLTLMIIIGFLLNRLVLAPLSALAGSSQQIARGNFDISLPLLANDEIGDLTRSFTNMARMVKDHTENLEQKVNDRTEELHRSTQQLAESNRQIMDSIKYARMIQSSILPDAALLDRYLREWFVIYQQRDLVGGDFYYFRATDTGYLVAVMDCTGHGVPGAFMTMTVNAVLNNIPVDRYPGDPAGILGELNRLVREALRHDSSGTAIDNGLDIGLCYCIPAEDRVVFAGAGLSLYVSDTDGVREIRGDRQRLGYRTSRTAYRHQNHEVPLGRDTCLYLCTDGVLDQGGGAHGFGFGRERLMQMLAGAAHLPMADRKGYCLNVLADYSGASPQRDDIVLLGLQIEGGGLRNAKL